VNIKYRNKIYSSNDLPIFVYFKTEDNRQDFINTLNNYQVGTFKPIRCIHSILAGNTLIKDKRSCIQFNIEDVEEKRILQKSLYNNDEENNAMLCGPGDIDEGILLDWIEKYINKIT
jgi:hypothetical protein